MPPSPKRQGGRKRVAAKRKVSEIEGGDPSHTAARKKRVRPYWSLTVNDSFADCTSRQFVALSRSPFRPGVPFLKTMTTLTTSPQVQ